MNIETLAMLGGVVSSYAYIPEVVKIVRKKSAEEISLISFGIWAISAALWLAYGISIQNYAIIFNYILGLLGASAIFFLAVFYDIKNRKSIGAASLIALALVLSPNTWAKTSTIQLPVGQSVEVDGVTYACETDGKRFMAGGKTYRCVR